MKSHDSVRLSTLRMLSSAFNYEKIESKHDLTEDEELAVIRKQAKQRKDSIESLRQAQGKHTSSSESGILDSIKGEEAELAILQEFLPPEMDESELVKLVDEAVAQTGAVSMADMGKVIGAVKAKAPNADGGAIAGLVKSRLG